ncbi:MAG: FAD-dependent 5-carboxymethylaminomethyl-2-thiouridine(34) oxidoreductase MnmC [Burkholderiaceae bacterium]|nr:FAD-dependent 5-carboxymethylaminomethyl-2-thiouridine(34) oxidoreductase MnmC [Burkholderiaceae bacterium]
MPALRPHPPLAFDESGTPVSTLYGDVFRSRAGAWSEARTVFVEGCELPRRWTALAGQGADASFTILELGFGLGVNFLATLQAWRERRGPPARLHFVSIEAHPLEAGDLRRALEAFGAPASDSQRLLAQWPLALPGLHRLAFDADDVTLTLCFGDAAALVPKLRLAADAFFLDGFAPARNPRMWEPALLRALGRLARPGAALATWSVAGAVREALLGAGFEAERVAGHADKRHRLRARHAPRWRGAPPPEPPPRWPERSVLVVGAGLAGAAVAAGFARRGWRATVVESAPAPLRGGSAQPLCADHLHLSPDDNPLARLTRAALGARALDPVLKGHAPLGKLLVDADDREAASRHAMLERLGFPGEFARYLPPDEASDTAGLRLPRGGLWLPRCDALDPAALARAWLDIPGVDVRAGAAAAALEDGPGGWVARDASGRELGAAAVAVLANAGDAPRLAALDSMPLRRVRGQSTLVERGRIGALRVVLGGDAYAAPLGDAILIGASFDDGESLEPSADVDAGNVGRLARMIGGEPRHWLAGARSGPVGHRYASADRMPAIGALPDESAAVREAAALLRNDRLALPRAHGLYGAFAFGSRGLLWATLAAALLPALAEGDPLPLESDLLRAVDPGRFVRRMLRRRRSD